MSLLHLATDPRQSKGRAFAQKPSSYRDPFQRDHDRIVHARAFRKLQHKTQVFVSHEGDFHRTRLTHSLEVAQVTRTVCRSLDLNEHLGQTLALAHDLGHPPFGHTGEDAINLFLEEQGAPPFDHNWQTISLVTRLESPYPDHPGLNLTWESLDGLIKHNGPLSATTLARRLADPDHSWLARSPFAAQQQASLEAQIAALSDDIAYNCHDLDDGLRGGFLQLADLKNIPQLWQWVQDFKTTYGHATPEQEIYNLHRLMITSMVEDLIETTRRRTQSMDLSEAKQVLNCGQTLAGFSDDLLAWLSPLRAYLFERLYRHKKVSALRQEATEKILALMKGLWANPKHLPNDWYEAFQANHKPLDLLVDYVSGMTDRYALLRYEALFNKA